MTLQKLIQDQDHFTRSASTSESALSGLKLCYSLGRWSIESTWEKFYSTSIKGADEFLSSGIVIWDLVIYKSFNRIQ